MRAGAMVLAILPHGRLGPAAKGDEWSAPLSPEPSLPELLFRGGRGLGVRLIHEGVVALDKLA